jgi:hypothetical protein
MTLYQSIILNEMPSDEVQTTEITAGIHSKPIGGSFKMVKPPPLSSSPKYISTNETKIPPTLHERSSTGLKRMNLIGDVLSTEGVDLVEGINLVLVYLLLSRICTNLKV